MPAPSAVEYATPTIVAAHTAVLGQIDAASSPAKLKLYDDADVLLATVTLTDPAGTVSAITGQVTLTAAGTSSAVASGECTYGVMVDGDDNAIVSVPAESGASAVPGKIVLSTTSIVNGADVELVSCVIG